MDSNPSLNTLQMDCLCCSPFQDFLDFTLVQNLPLAAHPFIHTENAHVEVMVVAEEEENLGKYQRRT